MSNRSLLEINHDFCDRITRDPKQFVADIERYLSSGSTETAAVLKMGYGINVYGMRHHSEAFDIRWGSYKASDNSITMYQPMGRK